MRKSLITEEPSIKEEMKLSMEYFDSKAFVKQLKIDSLKEFTKNQEVTHLCFLKIVCEVITRIFCMTAFWEGKVEI